MRIQYQRYLDRLHSLTSSENLVPFLQQNRGVVLKPNDDEGLAAAILRFAEQPEVVRGMGEHAKRAYLQKHTLNHAVERTLSALSGLGD